VKSAHLGYELDALVFDFSQQDHRDGPAAELRQTSGGLQGERVHLNSARRSYLVETFGDALDMNTSGVVSSLGPRLAEKLVTLDAREVFEIHVCHL
jgi:hypothetical protein